MEKLFKIATILFVAVQLSGCFSSDEDEVYAYCSAPDANEKLFTYLEKSYFWNEDLPAAYNPESAQDMFNAMYDLRAPDDRFSFILTEEDYQSNFVASTFFGYGFGHVVNTDKTGLVIRYVYEAGSAAQNGLRRGDTIIQVDDALISDLIPQIEAEQTSYAEIFGPNEDGYTVNIRFQKPSGEIIETSFSKSELVANTVMATQIKQVTADNETKDVGYLVFDSFRNVSVDELNSSFDQLKIDGVDELILDLRYNSGGLISVANQLSTQISGDNVFGEVFIQYFYNENESYKNDSTLFSLGNGLATLDLGSVVVLTTEASCSASELVINALSPHVDVTVIGAQTCGKPIGMHPTEICEHRVFAINFETVNSEGEGRYFDGLPVDCAVEDQIVGDWGTETDPLLSEGLQYLQTGACSPVSLVNKKQLIRNKKVIDYSKGPFGSRDEL